MRIICLLLSLCFAEAALTRIHFRNRCNNDLNLYVTKDFAPPTLYSTILPNHVLLGSFRNGSMNFHSGLDGKTRVEFWFNNNNMDYYDINVLTGFDVPVAIEPLNGVKIQCIYNNCPDGILFPHEIPNRLHSMPTNGSFTLMFCPPADNS